MPIYLVYCMSRRKSNMCIVLLIKNVLFRNSCGSWHLIYAALFRLSCTSHEDTVPWQLEIQNCFLCILFMNSNTPFLFHWEIKRIFVLNSRRFYKINFLFMLPELKSGTSSFQMKTKMCTSIYLCLGIKITPFSSKESIKMFLFHLSAVSTNLVSLSRDEM